MLSTETGRCRRRDIDALPATAPDGGSGPQADWEAPGSRVWLGNVSSAATVKAIATAFAAYGALADAAVFPSNVGPLCYGVRVRLNKLSRFAAG